MSGDVVVPPRCIKGVQTSNTEIPAISIPGLTASKKEWIQISAHLDVSEAQDWIRIMRRSVPGGEKKYHDGAVLVTVEDDEMCGVMEIGELMA